MPRGQKKVAYEVEPDIVRSFNEMYNIRTGPTPTVTKWCEMIKKLGVVADDKFLSAWLVVVFSCLLGPTTRLKVSPRAYSTALNPCEIVNSNVWQFVVGFGDKNAHTNLGLLSWGLETRT